ncbi:MAG: ABC transporter permease [Mycoplasmatales bacterium]|nr:ABC transporter permease [Mycoplasmatales bacterium]
MFKYIIKRLLLALLTIVVGLTIVFFLLRAIGKEPTAITEKISAASLGEKNLSPEQIAQSVYNEYNYNPNISSFSAFGEYIKNIFKGDFGYNFTNPTKTIPQQFSEPLKYTFLVSGTGFVFGTILGVTFGIFAGYKRGKLPDIALNVLSIIFVAVPSFVLASLLIIIANKTNWPTEFMSKEFAGGLWPMLKTLIIPISIITIFSFATIIYYVRNEVVEVLKSDYVATARSKGLSEYKIFMKHVMRNISIPAVTIILPRFVFIITGSFVIEQFFQVPGTASMFSTAVTRYEYNVIMFSVIFFSSLSLLVAILMDLLYTILDPRIRFAENSNFSLFKKAQKHSLRRKNAKMIKGGEQNE